MVLELKIVLRALRESARNGAFTALFLCSFSLALAAEILPLLIPLYMNRLQNIGGQPLDVFAFGVIFVYGPIKVLAFIFKNLVNILISGPLATCFATASSRYVAKLVFSLPVRLNSLSSSQVSAAVQQAQASFSGVIFVSFFLLLPKILGIVVSFFMVAYLLGKFYVLVLVFFVIAYLLLLRKNVEKVEAFKKMFGKRHASFCGMIEELWEAREFILLNGGWEQELSRFRREVEARRDAETALFQRLGYFELQQSLLIGFALSLITLLALVDYRSGVIKLAGLFIVGSAVKHFAVPFKECSSLFCNLMKHLAYLGNWVRFECLASAESDSDLSLQAFKSNSFGVEREIRLLDSAVVVDKVVLKKNKKVIFGGLSAVFPSGGMHVVRGANGSGKSSLLRVLVGLDALEDGLVLLGGHDISSFSWIEKSKIFGYVEQNPRLLTQTVDYNLFYGMDGEELKVHVLDEMQVFLGEGLWPGAKSWVGSMGQDLAKGAVTKIRIAQAVLKNPRILVLDEPTNNLDVASQKQLLLILRKLATYTTVIVATHHPALLVECDSMLDLSVVNVACPVSATENQRASL